MQRSVTARKPRLQRDGARLYDVGWRQTTDSFCVVSLSFAVCNPKPPIFGLGLGLLYEAYRADADTRLTAVPRSITRSAPACARGTPDRAMHSDHMMAEAAAAAYKYPLNGAAAGVGGVDEGGWRQGLTLAHFKAQLEDLLTCGTHRSR